MLNPMRRIALPAAVLMVVIGTVAAAGGAAAKPKEAKVHKDPATDARGPLEIRSASLRQRGRGLVLVARTRGRWGLGSLARFPDTPGAGHPFLCLRLRQSGPVRQLCLGSPDRRGRDRLGSSRVTSSGSSVDRKTIRVRVSRPRPHTVEVAFGPRAAGLRFGRIDWALVSRSRQPDCDLPDSAVPCTDRLPDREARIRVRFRRTSPAGCTRGGPSLRAHGGRGRKLVALTFDDGPSAYTSRVARVLERFRARATFFVIGDQVGGNAAVMRRLLRRGHELANHSMHHTTYPSGSDLAATSRAIRRATGFRPCLFRPPGGAVEGALVQRARGEGMTTIGWDVDPRDWANPGTGAIVSSVLGSVRPGSIVVMHDGGGGRSQTLDALPPILKNLRRRGYRAVTVTRLLGHRFIYQG